VAIQGDTLPGVLAGAPIIEHDEETADRQAVRFRPLVVNLRVLWGKGLIHVALRA
jgi:methyl coenzyme M reductase subunit D